MTSKQKILFLDLVCPQLRHAVRISEFAAAGAHQFAKLEIRQVLLLDRSSAISKISRSFFVLPLRLSSWQASVFKQRTLWGPSVSSQVKLSSRQVVEQWKMRPLFWGRFDKNLSVRSYLANKNFRSSKIYWSSTTHWGWNRIFCFLASDFWFSDPKDIFRNSVYLYSSEKILL